MQVEFHIKETGKVLCFVGMPELANNIRLIGNRFLYDCPKDGYWHKYADLIISMSLDFKMGKIDWEHYKNMLKLISEKLEKEGD